MDFKRKEGALPVTISPSIATSIELLRMVASMRGSGVRKIPCCFWIGTGRDDASAAS